LVILVIGYLIAKIIKKIVNKVAERVKLDQTLERSKAGQWVEKVSPGGNRRASSAGWCSGSSSSTP